MFLAPKDWAKRIQKEWRILEEHLPETIFVRAYESRMDLLRAVIIGVKGTPYHDGLFFFDVYFPSSYPVSPPLVRYRSGGFGINPNVYECGEVCLSLSKTFDTPKEEIWVPGTSTMLQLLVFIQDQLLNTKPLFLEFGFENSRGHTNGEFFSLLYNENILVKSLKTMMYTMTKPPKNFESLVVGHFCSRVRDILMACKAYILDGLQVGCLVNGVQEEDSKQRCSLVFQNDVAYCITPLVRAFVKLGAKEAKEFLPLSAMITPLPTLALNPPADEVMDANLNDRANKKRKEVTMAMSRGTTQLDSKDRNRSEKKARLDTHVPSSRISLRPTISEEHKSEMKKMVGGFSKVGIYSLTDVTVNQDATNSPLSWLDDKDAVKMYKGFKKFDTVLDHSDHLFSGRETPMMQSSKEWTQRIQEERRILEEQLPDNIC